VWHHGSLWIVAQSRIPSRSCLRDILAVALTRNGIAHSRVHLLVLLVISTVAREPRFDGGRLLWIGVAVTRIVWHLGRGDLGYGLLLLLLLHGPTVHCAALHLRRRASVPRPAARAAGVPAVLLGVLGVLRRELRRVLRAHARGLLRAAVPWVGVAVAGVDGRMTVASPCCCCC